MAVLLIEDNPQKRVAIERVVRDATGFGLEQAENIAVAYRLIDIKQWMCIILDMAFDTSRARGKERSQDWLAGIEILQYLADQGAKIPVIVATQHASFPHSDIKGIDSVAKLDTMLQNRFSDIYKGVVRVDLASDKWKADLASKLRGLK